MDWIVDLFTGGSVAHSILVYSLVIALGVMLGKVKFFGISLGTTFVLFVGILMGHLGLSVDSGVLHFIREFGLILFIFSIGMQVGPGFFSSFKKGGLVLNGLAMLLIGLNIVVALVIYYGVGNVRLTDLVGILSGAVTNTPGLGAAQAAYSDMFGSNEPDIALGYAVAYPLGVVGAILSFILLKYLLYRDPSKLQRQENSAPVIDVKAEIKAAEQAIIKVHHEAADTRFISRRFLISKRRLNGVTLGSLNFEEILGASVTRIRRAGVEIKATPRTKLQYGDLVTVIGSKESVANVEKVLGNSLKRLDNPNLVPLFFGIAIPL